MRGGGEGRMEWSGVGQAVGEGLGGRYMGVGKGEGEGLRWRYALVFKGATIAQL